ncbi:hypothetical protein PanWU01x14_283880, partial [Parasponia andersonii]
MDGGSSFIKFGSKIDVVGGSNEALMAVNVFAEVHSIPPSECSRRNQSVPEGIISHIWALARHTLFTNTRRTIQIYHA